MKHRFTVYVDMWMGNDEVDLEDVRLNTDDEPPEKGVIRILVPITDLPNFEKVHNYRVTFEAINVTSKVSKSDIRNHREGRK